MDALERLLDRARAAVTHAYVPYSHFRVGAAVEDAEGNVYVGCNVESATYGLTICAERNAIFSAIANGAGRPFRGLAVTCADAPAGACSPCGACRQIIAEHLARESLIRVDGLGDFRPAELLPHMFTFGVLGAK
ncbi:MAG: cytidine deaminase [Chloroflexota bacterium]